MSSANSLKNSDHSSLENSGDESDIKTGILSNLPSLKIKSDNKGKFNERRRAPEIDEEDTLQGMNKAVHPNPVPGFNSDEDTLHASDAKHNLRIRHLK